MTRCRPEFVERHRGGPGLAWAQIRAARPHGNRSISAIIIAAFATLRERGLVYPCFCSRRDMAETVRLAELAGRRSWQRDPDGAPLYPGTCRQSHAGQRRERATLIPGGSTWRLPCRMVPEKLAYRRLEAHGEMSLQTVDPCALGRRRHRPSRNSHELSSLRRRGRRPAGDHPCGARPGSRGRDRPARPAAAICSACRHPSITITRSYRTQQGDKLAKSRFSRDACGNCESGGCRRRTCGGCWDLAERFGPSRPRARTARRGSSRAPEPSRGRRSSTPAPRLRRSARQTG